MSPPLTPADREELRRIMREIAREEAAEKVRPLEQRASKLSGKFHEIREEVSPAVARKISDSQHEIEDRSMGFERLILSAVTSARQETAELRELVAKSIPPAAVAAKGAEAAAVAGAQAMQRTEGKTEAVQVAANRADSQSLAAQKWSKLSPVITVISTAFLMGVYKFVEWLIAHAATGGPP